jgi:peptidoglycan/LPS O-acetylase OafA/YrhL
MSTLSSAQHPSLKYRSDIDGLRAVAVLAVLIFHLGMPLHGGFVGVDVFFVISGFLIGSIILGQVSAGTFTFSSFYERRIRRIFPALMAMLAVTCLLAYRYLLPRELMDFARSLMAADFSASNFYFWRQSGYFDSPASSKPLLHTWSLGVEEQFYIGLPIVIVLLKKLAPNRIGVSVIGLAAVSFAVSVVGAYRYPTATFYLVPGRAWELLLGTMLSLDSFPRLRKTLARELAGLLGLGLILGSSWAYQASTPFPGLAALVPCGGAALIIAAGRDGRNWVGRVLSLKPIVFVGTISYSLYLWHWPIIVFFSLGMTIIKGLTRHQSQILTFSVSLVAATLSWRFVELPFRRKNQRLSRPALFRYAGVAVAGMAILGAIALWSNGLANRFSPEAQGVARYLEVETGHNQYRNGTCFMAVADWDLGQFDSRDCLPDAAGKATYLILGDSHAAHLWWGMNLVYPDANVMQATSVGCKPVLEQRPRQFPGCTRLMSYMLEKYLPTHHVDTVILEARWESDDLPSLSRTLDWLRSQHVHVVLLGPMLQYDAPLPRLLAMGIRQHDPLLPRVHRVMAFSALDVQMAGLARSDWRVPYVSMIDLLCEGDDCLQYAAPGIPLLSDYGHLTEEGSTLVARKLREGGRLR